MKIVNSGPSALKLLFDKLSAAWQIKDLQSGVERLRSFGVASDVKIVDYIRQVTTVMGVHGIFAPTSTQAQTAVRDSQLNQFPTIMNIDPQPSNNADPFLAVCPHWPLDGHFGRTDEKRRPTHFYAAANAT